MLAAEANADSWDVDPYGNVVGKGGASAAAAVAVVAFVIAIVGGDARDKVGSWTPEAVEKKRGAFPSDGDGSRVSPPRPSHPPPRPPPRPPAPLPPPPLLPPPAAIADGGIVTAALAVVAVLRALFEEKNEALPRDRSTPLPPPPPPPPLTTTSTQTPLR